MTYDLDKINAFFKGDVYAMEQTGVTIEEAGEGYAVCSFIPDEKHANADGVVQGGAIYTLADFCFAVAANAKGLIETGRPTTVTLSANASYLRPAKLGEKLVAKANCVKQGRSACYYQVQVASEREPDRIIASVVINGMSTHTH